MFEKIEAARQKILAQDENNKLIQDYGIYNMTLAEKMLYVCLAAVIIYIFAFVFYRSHLISALFTPLAIIYPRIRRAELLKKRQKELNLQFKDMLYSLSSSLSAGKSIENSFREVVRDLSVLYPDPDAYIIVETGYMARKIEMNETAEAVLADFARRAHIDDIDNFVDVLQTCKRAGGNMVEVIRNTSGIINDKIEIGQEIDMLLAQRRFEQKILNVMPVFMVVLLSLTAYEYMAPVFTTYAGRLVMTIAIFILIGAYLLSRKIMDIKI